MLSLQLFFSFSVYLEVKLENPLINLSISFINTVWNPLATFNLLAANYANIYLFADPFCLVWIVQIIRSPLYSRLVTPCSKYNYWKTPLVYIP
jgi:hypothetical protein